MAWRAALEDPALTAPTDHAALLARARAAIDAHPNFQRHGPGDGEALEPQMLAQVVDFIGRMANNPLGVYLLRTFRVRDLRNLMDRPSMHNVAGQALIDTLVESCGEPGYTGDGYVTLALIMAGVADPHEATRWGQHGSHVLGPPATTSAHLAVGRQRQSRQPQGAQWGSTTAYAGLPLLPGYLDVMNCAENGCMNGNCAPERHLIVAVSDMPTRLFSYAQICASMGG